MTRCWPQDLSLPSPCSADFRRRCFRRRLLPGQFATERAEHRFAVELPLPLGHHNTSTSFEAGNDIRATIPRFTPRPGEQPGRGGAAHRDRGAQERHSGPDFVGLAAGAETVDRPDPGTRKLHRLDENLAAADVTLPADELTGIEEAAAKIHVQGGRYNEAGERMTNL
ncbi:aldo/Keto reductase [Arthrobacter sp. Hiyo4]|nr:aldo/Keto reductase [Arthrobacter sp. Hiyo4]